MRMTHARWFGLVAATAMGLTACEPQSPTAPELGRDGIEMATEDATADAAIGAAGQLFFYNDAGLTRSYPGSPCQVDPAYRDFDFWLGEWNVTSGGAQAGTNHILSLLDGCLVEENWTGAGGGQGRSMNAYDAATGNLEPVLDGPVRSAPAARGRPLERRHVDAGSARHGDRLRN